MRSPAKMKAPVQMKTRGRVYGSPKKGDLTPKKGGDADMGNWIECEGLLQTYRKISLNISYFWFTSVNINEYKLSN